MVDVDVAAAVVPYVSAAVAAYGGALWQRVQDTAADAAADATVGVGRRVLQVILGRGEAADGVREAVDDLAADPGNEDAVPTLRQQLRKLLAADADLGRELAGLVAQGPVSVTASGERSIAAQTIHGLAITGDNANVTR